MQTELNPFDLPLPSNLDAEIEICGSMMVYPDVIPDVFDALQPDDFYYTPSKLIYIAIRSLFEKRVDVNVVTVSDFLKEHGMLDDVGGRNAVDRTALVSSGVAVSHFVMLVKDASARRSYIDAAWDIAENCHSAPRAMINEIVIEKIQSIQQPIQQSFCSLANIIPKVWDTIQNRYENQGELQGTSSGLLEFDSRTNGFQPGDVVILAARPSMGKTALGLQMIHHAASLGLPTLIFSLEMTKEQLVERLISMASGVDGMAIRSGRIKLEQWSAISKAIADLGETPLIIHDRRDVTINSIRALAIQAKNTYPGLRMIMVDYLQLIAGGDERGENRVQEISKISRGLKTLSGDLGVTTLALSQLSRAVESREDKRPRLSDLRDSGSLEQDADIVLSLYRDDYYDKDSKASCTAELAILKQRNGPQSVMKLGFRAEITKFMEIKHYL